EANETFLVNLSSAVNATIFDSVGVGVILNDDAATAAGAPTSSAAAAGAPTSSATAPTASATASASASRIVLALAGAAPDDFAPHEFAVTVNGQAVPIVGLERDGDSVTLLLADGALQAGDVVVV